MLLLYLLTISSFVSTLCVVAAYSEDSLKRQKHKISSSTAEEGKDVKCRKIFKNIVVVFFTQITYIISLVCHVINCCSNVLFIFFNSNSKSCHQRQSHLCRYCMYFHFYPSLFIIICCTSRFTVKSCQKNRSTAELIKYLL